ncbi:MAG TPA: hypothetical protein VKC89_03085 [Patescibacteria group bacterium]|nr:hypothetical protein [Patescibacteria group bacterium]
MPVAKKTLKKTEEKLLSSGINKELSSTTQISQIEQNLSPHDVRTLLAWTGPGRPFRKRGKQYFLTAILIVFLVEIILFLFSQYLLMLVVLSLLFLSFALATVPPRDFHYRISNQGITVEDHSYLWIELYDFYFKKRENVDILHVRTKALLPGELTMTLGEIDREHVKTVLLPYLPYRETVRPTFMEKSGDWLAKNFPLESSK